MFQYETGQTRLIRPKIWCDILKLYIILLCGAVVLLYYLNQMDSYVWLYLFCQNNDEPGSYGEFDL